MSHDSMPFCQSTHLQDAAGGSRAGLLCQDGRGAEGLHTHQLRGVLQLEPRPGRHQHRQRTAQRVPCTV